MANNLEWKNMELAPCPVCGGRMKAFQMSGTGYSELRCIEPRGTGHMTYQGPEPGERPYELMLSGCGLQFSGWIRMDRLIWRWNEGRMAISGMTGEKL